MKDVVKILAKHKDLTKGKRYGFYLGSKYITALYTGERDSYNNNLIFICKRGIHYSVPMRDVLGGD